MERLLFFILSFFVLLGCSSPDNNSQTTTEQAIVFADSVLINGTVRDITTISLLENPAAIHTVIFVGDEYTGKWWCILQSEEHNLEKGDLFTRQVHSSQIISADTAGLEKCIPKIKSDPLREIGEEKIPKWEEE